VPSKDAKRTNARERIIDAAMAIVFEDGARKLSLDAVAERAGVSKGGLLYHFKSKSDLLKGMVARHIAILEDAVAAAHAEIAKDNKPNALIRAYLQAVFVEICTKKKPHTGLLAAIAEEPELLAPVRAHNTRLVAELRAASETPDLAQVALLAVEGSWHMRLFDISPFDDAALKRQFDALTELLANPPARRDEEQPS